MTEAELARLFDEGVIADDPDRSVEFETVEEWLAIADGVFRKKRLRELIRASKEGSSEGSDR